MKSYQNIRLEMFHVNGSKEINPKTAIYDKGTLRNFIVCESHESYIVALAKGFAID